MKITHDKGLTLTEILIALVILATLIPGISALIANASQSLERSSKSSLMTRQTLGFISDLKYDVISSYDLYAFAGVYPFSTCSPNLVDGIIEQRAWLKVDIKEISQSAPGDYNFVTEPRKKWAIYSLVKKSLPNEFGQTWFISRSYCDQQTGNFETLHELLLPIATTSEINLTKLTSGQTVRCSGTLCSIGESTAASSSYSFELPAFENSNRILRELVLNNLSNLSPRIPAEARQEFGES